MGGPWRQPFQAAFAICQAVCRGREGDLLDSNPAQVLFDFRQGDQIAGPCSGTRFADFSPAFGAGEIGGPEGPCATLAWTCGVDSASPVLAQEHAIPVGILQKASADPDLSGVLSLKLLHGEAGRSSQRFDFVLVDPDIARFAGATVTAASASKGQTFVVPRGSGHSQSE